jgi:CRP-like cAMP-binding protein
MTERKTIILAGHALLRRWGLHECDDALRHARFERYRAMEKIFQKGDPESGLMAVLKGRVKLSSKSPDGKEALFEILEPGRIFGEVALLDGKPRSHDATALEDTEVLVLNRRDLLPILQTHPQICVDIIMDLCGRLRRTDEMVEDMLFLGLSSRLAKRLLRLGERFGRPDPQGRTRIDMTLTQQDVASLVGMTRESINKQIGRWRDAGIVDFDRGIITICDSRRLREIAEPAPAAPGRPAAPSRVRPLAPPRGTGPLASAAPRPVSRECPLPPEPALPPRRSRWPHA